MGTFSMGPHMLAYDVALRTYWLAGKRATQPNICKSGWELLSESHEDDPVTYRVNLGSEELRKLASIVVTMAKLEKDDGYYLKSVTVESVTGASKLPTGPVEIETIPPWSQIPPPQPDEDEETTDG